MFTGQEQWLVNHAKFGQHRYQCPWCSSARRKKTETCLSALKDDTSIKFQCHHPECGVSGLIRLNERTPLKLVHTVEKKTPVRNLDEFQTVDDRHLDWLSKRGISAKTAHNYKLIGQEINGQAVVGFPYFNSEGGVVAIKKRFTGEKRFLCEGSPDSFFGLRHLKKGEDIVIVEGEMDVLAMAEAGIVALSIPNGAPMKVTEGKIDPAEDTKFKFLWAAKEFIDAAQKVIIATDMDVPGEAVAEEIARRVGKGKCWRVKLPSGTKDANDLLLKEGPEGLRRATEAADPWPVEGLYDAKRFESQVWELFEKGIGRGESTGYQSVDDIYTIVPGQVSIVTGIPSSGKSEFIDQIMVNMASDKGWKFGICSFENEPRLHITKLIAKRAGKPFFKGYHERMTRHEYEAAYSFVQDHFAFVHQDDGGLANLDSILDRLRAAIMRYGIRGAVIDPYNFISRDNRNTSETEWISDMLTKVKAFAMGHGVHIWFVAHPTKMQRSADGRLPVPGGFDISGSAAWFAKADCGLTVHREKDDPLVAQVHVWKCRFSWVGKQGQTNLLYDVGTTRYSEMQGEIVEGREFDL
jgi:twinkle protein